MTGREEYTWAFLAFSRAQLRRRSNDDGTRSINGFRGATEDEPSRRASRQPKVSVVIHGCQRSDDVAGSDDLELTCFTTENLRVANVWIDSSCFCSRSIAVMSFFFFAVCISQCCIFLFSILKKNQSRRVFHSSVLCSAVILLL